MSMSVLLVNDKEGVEKNIRALLESKITEVSINECLISQLYNADKVLSPQFDLTQYDLMLVKDNPTAEFQKIKDTTVLHWQELSDLSSKIDVSLQLRRYLAKYPLNLKDWALTEVIHNSQDCIIYRAINTGAKRKGLTAAIKRFKFEPKDLSKEMVQQFLHRVEKQCAIRSEGLVHFYDGGIYNDAFYLVMEYLEHGTLRQNLNSCNHDLPEVHALEWFREIADALQCVHNAGLIHRDLKIDNIMLRADGTLALTDYGVSKRILLDAGYLQEDELHCSPYYVSPELITGKPCTQATDIYSLGVIFYELLTGEKPYIAKQIHELMMHHVMAPIPEFPDDKKHFQPLLDKMLAKCQRDRFANASDAIQLLNSIVEYDKSTPPHF